MFSWAWEGVVEFRILGPLELIVDGTVRTLPAGGERAVLELLLLNAGRVVPASTLMDALWGEDLPGNAANALQGRISRLRKALADAGLPQVLVTTRRPGYVADAARYPDEVAGMVLIDSTAPASEAPGAASPDDRTSYDVTGRVSALASSSARLGLGRLLAGLAASGLPPRSRDEVSAKMATAGSLRSTIDEYVQPSAAGQAAALTDFAGKPLVVLTAGSGQ
jgi:DNA-binding winged helix-turn-helix (wHTH) protein